MIQIDEPVLEEEWWGDLAEGTLARPEEEPGPVTVAHVVDQYNRYPGEVVTFYTRIEIREPLADLTLRISLPLGLTLGYYRAPVEQAGLMPETEFTFDNSYLVWAVAGDLAAGTRYEYQAEAVINPTGYDLTLTSQAVVYGPKGDILTQESVNIAVWAKGKYLQHLPSIYEQDDLMGRFLMLFESFWAPIELQIDSMYNYFDPRITSSDFLLWLATWLDLELDERWPEKRLRQLLRWAIALYRSRGTKWGVLKYLEIYTGQQAEIIERRARNFVLGPDSRLGPGIALGHRNRPHTFTVNLRLPPVEGENKQERQRQEQLRRRTIESIIDLQKPAHTVYNLNIKPLTDREKTADDKPKKKKSKKAGDEISAQAAIWFKLDD